jgi:hypothetical protein
VVGTVLHFAERWDLVRSYLVGGGTAAILAAIDAARRRWFDFDR